MKRSAKKLVSLAFMFSLVLSFFGDLPAKAALKENYVKAENGETHTIAAFNVLRGSNQIVVYTPEFGTSTKNNRWGIEVVVSGGKVTEVRDGPVDETSDSPIPADGFVVSAHGTAREWVKAHLIAGSSVEILRDVILEPIKEAQRPANKIDPEAPFEFPGGRGADELVVYTPAYAGNTTGTNQYGYEIIVKDGVVVKMGGNNNEIPANGMVLSGHGISKDWLIQNTQVGAKVAVNLETKVVSARIDPSAYIYSSQVLLNEMSKLVEKAEQELRDVPIEKAESYLEEARQNLEKAEAAYRNEQWDLTIEHAEMAAKASQNAYFNTVESRVSEGRGVWHRPIEKNREEIVATLDKLEAANYNQLFLETFYHGYTIYPSKINKQNPQFAGWDPLKVFIEEGKKRGIEVHGWVHTFFVGHESLQPPGPILSEHPDWAAVDRSGRIPSQREPGYYWVNPALPEVRDYLSSVFNEMVKDYELDGLHLDYIRYPVSMPIEDGFSYDTYSRSEFEKLYGGDPLEITPTSDPELWKKWNKWRENNISTFVERIHSEVKEVDSEIDLSTAVFPEVSDAIDKKFQNWIDWVEKGQMDFITPMVYSVDENWVGNTTKDFLANMKSPILSYIGLAPFIGFDDELLVKQVDVVNQAGAAGNAQFAYHKLNEEHFTAMQEGPQRTKAIVPHDDPEAAGLALAEDLKHKVKDIYVERGTITFAESAPITGRLGDIMDRLNESDVEGALDRVEDLKAFIEKRDLDKVAAERMYEQLDYMQKVLSYGVYKASK